MTSRGALLSMMLAGVTACSAPAERPHTAGSPPPPKTTATAIATTTTTEPPPDPHRRPLGSVTEEALPVELLPMAGGARVLAIADEGERGAWARTIDGNAAFGRLRWFEGAHVVTAMQTDDGRETIVTSDGDRLCVTTFRATEDAETARRCEAVRPEVVVPIGDRIALLYADVTEAKSAKVRPVSKPKSIATPKKKEEKKGGAKAATTKTGSAPRAGAAGAPPSAGSTKSAARTTKKTLQKKAPAKKGKTRAEAIATAAAKAKVDVRLTWMTREGQLDATSSSVGITFERPLAGMMIADVASRGPVADLLFYEAVAKPKERSKTPLGSARLGVASVDADGHLVAGSRGTLAEGDLEYGLITGQNGPRLVANANATSLITFAGRAGACQSTRLFPTLGPAVAPRAACLVDPIGAAVTGSQTPWIESIFAMDPRRAPGQVKADGPLVAWAGDRAFFNGASGFTIAARPSSPSPATSTATAPATSPITSTTTSSATSPVVSAPPFPARRSRVAWSAFAPDGEGIALVAGTLHRIDSSGALSEIASAAALDALGPRASGIARRAEGRADDTRRAARIGDAFFLARGDVVRLSPAPMKLEALAGRALTDASVLVGGSDHGLFIELASGAMRVTSLTKDGAIQEASRVTSSVRSGFDATERARGGAIVAGVSANDPTKVVALTIDADGHVSAPKATSLTVSPGAFGVRVVALPSGGAWLMDRERRHVAWLDDDAIERGSAAIPADHARASCAFGRPAPTSIPSTEPGKLVTIEELARPGTCITGDVAWTAKGGLRWFGAAVRGLDAIAEVAAIEAIPSAPSIAPASPTSAATTADTTTATLPLTATTASSASPKSASDATSATDASAAAGASRSSHVTLPSAGSLPAKSISGKIACPGDMVSIAGNYCVDRFESTLVDGKTGRVLSPDYPSTPNLLEIVLGDWATDRAHWGDAHARAFPLPEVPSWQRGVKMEPLAIPLFGARPSGYVTGLVAESACAAVGKRLCTLDEFTTACRGEDDTDFPYGTEYQDGVCNVYREEHPAGLLHHNASFGHLDPRLNRVRAKGRPLFETTGSRPACRSVWGDDAVYDLVGNLDEWVDEGVGAFAGGFYSRSTRAGCDAVITAHPKVYADYSTGIRCCKDADK